MTHSIRQMFLALAGCAVATLLLESGGLASWAHHLELGPLRTVAVPVTERVERALRPLGMAALREEALESLARVGWSDDPALLAMVSAPSAMPNRSGCATEAAPAGLGSAAGALAKGASFPSPAQHNGFLNAAGAQAPLATGVPRVTVLAPLPPIEPGKQRVVALAGDSMMAVGLSATLMRQVAGNGHLRIVKTFRSGTGLARPEVFNWMDEYPAMLGAEKPEVVIVAIGANDAQGFVVDGKVLAFASDAWEKVYQQRVASYLAMVSAGGARVVWMGLPPMRIPVYDEKMATLNRICYTVVSQSPQAVWWNPTPFVGDEAGRYREYLTLANGRSMRIRAADGIHLSDEGAGLLTPVLLKWLDPPPPAVASAQTAPVASAPPAAPVARPKRHSKRAARG